MIYRQTDRHGNIQTDSRVTMSLVSTLQEKLPWLLSPRDEIQAAAKLREGRLTDTQVRVTKK